MNTNVNYDQRFGITDMLGRIEDKLLERGTFTKVLGAEFNLSTSIEEIYNDEDYGHCFDLIIKIDSPKRKLEDDKAEQVADVIGDMLIELSEEALTEADAETMRDSLRETMVYFNEKLVY